MIKALDHGGRVHLFKEPVSSNEAWFVAKNPHATNVREYAKVWSAKKTYVVGYSEPIEERLKELSARLEVSTCKRL